MSCFFKALWVPQDLQTARIFEQSTKGFNIKSAMHDANCPPKQACNINSVDSRTGLAKRQSLANLSVFWSVRFS